MSHVGGIRPRAAQALAGLGLVMLAGCGDTITQPAWVPGHPDTAVLSFSTTAPGVCALTVQYPNEAPAAITRLGSLYVQVRRDPRPPGAVPGTEVDHTGDWHVYALPGGDLLLLTPANAFDYRQEQAC
jgi:hypothetical protein